MKGMSVRFKITLWFAVDMLIIAIFTMAAVLATGGSVIRKGIRDDLIAIVEGNIDEVEFLRNVTPTENGRTVYISYADGYIEIDYGFLDIINGVYTALYTDDGELLYGEDPTAARFDEMPFMQGGVRTVETNGVDYYVYDCFLTGDDIGHLRLRGAVSTENGAGRINELTTFCLWMIPLLVIIATLGGYMLAGYFLRPIRNISDTAERIRVGGDLKSRIGLGAGDDEIHRLAHTFDAMFDRLERAFASEQQFTSDVSHELRTPVSVILSQCEYTLEKPRSQEEYIEALELIKRQSRKMSGMVNEILTFTRMEQDPEGISKETIDMSALVESLCKDLSLIKDKNILLESNISNGIQIYGNAELLTRLITNLISNAYRYGKENGHITVELDEGAGNAVLTVKDDGIGIAEDKLDKIWDRFYQADPSRNSKGTGLGLCMVKQIAHIHGGTCTVQSILGEGSIFTVKLKLQAETP